MTKFLKRTLAFVCSAAMLVTSANFTFATDDAVHEHEFVYEYVNEETHDKSCFDYDCDFGIVNEFHEFDDEGACICGAEKTVDSENEDIEEDVEEEFTDEDVVGDDVVHDFKYINNDDGTHTVTCTCSEFYIPKEGEDMHNMTLSCGFETYVEDHTFEDGVCAYCGALDPDVVELVERTISAECLNEDTGEIATFTVAGPLPEDAELVVKASSADELISIQELIASQLNTETDAYIPSACYDITIKVGDAEYQPEDFGESVTVTMSNLWSPLMSAVMYPAIVHIEDSTNNVEVVDIDENESQILANDDNTDFMFDSASFETSSFSRYAICANLSFHDRMLWYSNTPGSVVDVLRLSSGYYDLSTTDFTSSSYYKTNFYSYDSNNYDNYNTYGNATNMMGYSDYYMNFEGCMDTLVVIARNMTTSSYDSSGSANVVYILDYAGIHDEVSAADYRTTYPSCINTYSRGSYSASNIIDAFTLRKYGTKYSYDCVMIDQYMSSIGSNAFNGLSVASFVSTGSYNAMKSVRDSDVIPLFPVSGDDNSDPYTKDYSSYQYTNYLTSIGDYAFANIDHYDNDRNYCYYLDLYQYFDDAVYSKSLSLGASVFENSPAWDLEKSLIPWVTQFGTNCFKNAEFMKTWYWDKQYRPITLYFNPELKLDNPYKLANDAFYGTDIRDLTIAGGKDDPYETLNVSAQWFYTDESNATIQYGDENIAAMFADFDWLSNSNRKLIVPVSIPKSWNAGDGSYIESAPSSYTSEAWLKYQSYAYNKADTSVYHTDAADASDSVVVTLDYTNGEDISEGLTLNVSGSGYMMNWFNGSYSGNWYDTFDALYAPWDQYIYENAEALGITASTDLTIHIEDGVKGIGSYCFSSYYSNVCNNVNYFASTTVDPIPDSVEYIHQYMFRGDERSGANDAARFVKNLVNPIITSIPANIHANITDYRVAYDLLDVFVCPYGYLTYDINCYDEDGTLLTSPTPENNKLNIYYNPAIDKVFTTFKNSQRNTYLPWDSTRNDVLRIDGYMPNFEAPDTAPLYFESSDLSALELAYEYVECSDAPLRFVNYDDTLIKTVADYKTGDHIDVPTITDDMYPETNGRAYFFVGWQDNSGKVWGSGDLANLALFREAQTLKAVYNNDYESAIFTVIFKDGTGNIISSEEYAYNEEITVPDLPTGGYFADDHKYYRYIGWSPVVRNRCTEDATYVATSVSDNTSVPPVSYTYPVYYDGSTYNGYGKEATILYKETNFTWTGDGYNRSGADDKSAVIAYTQQQFEDICGTTVDSTVIEGRVPYDYSGVAVNSLTSGYFYLLDAMTDDHIDTIRNQYRITSFKDVDTDDIYSAFDFYTMEAYQICGHTYTPIVELYTSSMSGADGSHFIVVADEGYYDDNSDVTSMTRHWSWNPVSAANITSNNISNHVWPLTVYTNLNDYDYYIVPYNLCSKFQTLPFYISDDMHFYENEPVRSETYYCLTDDQSMYRSYHLLANGGNRMISVCEHDKALVSARYGRDVYYSPYDPYAENVDISVAYPSGSSFGVNGYGNGKDDFAPISTTMIDALCSPWSCAHGCSSYTECVNNHHDGYAFTGRYAIVKHAPTDWKTNFDISKMDVVEYFTTGDSIDLLDSNNQLKSKFGTGKLLIVPELTKLSSDNNNQLTVTYKDWDGSVIVTVECAPHTYIPTLVLPDMSSLTRPDTIRYGKATSYTFSGFKCDGYIVAPNYVDSNLTFVAMYAANTVNVNYTVALPASISVGAPVLNNNSYTATGNYEISATGDFSSDYKLVVEPSVDSFSISNGTNNLSACISQSKGSFLKTDIDAGNKISGTVTINNVDVSKPGTYTGAIKFLFELKRNN